MTQWLFSPGKTDPDAIIKANLIHKDHEQHGFFRIGGMPLLAVEDFNMRVLSPETAPDGFLLLKQWLEGRDHKLRHMELRQAVFTIEGAVTNRLECGTASVTPNGRWNLRGGVLFCSGTNRLSAGSAIFEPWGAHAGRITTQGDSAVAADFFLTQNQNQNLTTKGTTQ